MGTVTELAEALTPRGARTIYVGVVAATVTTIVVLVTALGFARNPVWSIQRGGSVWLVLVWFSGIAVLMIAVWAARIEHPYASVGLAVTTAGLLVPFWAEWSWLPGTVRSAVLAAAPFAVSGAAHVVLRWSVRPGPAGALWMVYLLAAAGSVIHLAGYDPFEEPACARTCADIRPVARSILSTRSAVTTTCLLTVLATLVAAFAIGRARPPQVPRSVRVGSLAALGALATSSVVRLASWEHASTSDLFLVLPPVAAATLVGGSVCVVAAETRRTRMAVDRLVIRLSEPQTALSDLGGAIRAVHFAVPGDGRWVDAAGRYVEDVPSKAASVVMSDESGPVLRLLLARSRDTADVLEGLTPATRLALRNAQLAAVAQARLAEVEASRRRIVAVSDDERRRIERDLHDGAQQRLVSAAFHLSVARGLLPETVAQLAPVDASVREALTHLRLLAHGIFPSVLATEGLEAALDDLVSASDVPATLEVRGVEDLNADTAMAAYATVVAALDHVAPTSIATYTRVSVVQDDRTLTVCVETPGVGQGEATSEFTEIADRVGAVGGQFTMFSTDGGTVITVALPCAS
jgi:signal transduction histidine kinase